MYNKRFHSMSYYKNIKHTFSKNTHGAHFFENKNKIIKRHFSLSFTLLYPFIRSCKFVITETGAYNIAHDENAMSSLIIQTIH